MAHPHHHEARATNRAKLKAITGHSVLGRPHIAEGQASKAFAKSFHGHAEHKAHGGKAHHRLDRRARGGKTKKHGNVNIAIVHKSHPDFMPAGGMGAPLGGAPMPPPGLAGGMPPPGAMPPPGGMPGMPQKRGGRTYRKGGAVHSDVAEDKKLFKKMMAAHEKKEMKVEGKLHHKARGGSIGKYPLKRGGMESGEGRLAYTKAMKKKYP